MHICYKREWNAHANRMLNIFNLENFGEAKAILLFSCRIFERNTVIPVNRQQIYKKEMDIGCMWALLSIMPTPLNI